MTIVQLEYERAADKFRPFNSDHEGYAILKEEVDELWDEIKANNHSAAFDKAVQVAAMAVRFLYDNHRGLAWDEQINKALTKLVKGQKDGNEETNGNTEAP